MLTALVAAVSWSCGGGGDGGGPIQPPPASLTYTPTAPAPANSLSLGRANGTDPNQLVVELQGRGVTDLYGVAFDLTYPSVLRYEGATEGTWLSASGAAQTSLQVAPQTGRLVIGLSRLGAIGGASGDGALLSLRFTAVAAGNGALQFSNPEAFTSTSAAYTVQWIGGSVSVVR